MRKAPRLGAAFPQDEIGQDPGAVEANVCGVEAIGMAEGGQPSVGRGRLHTAGALAPPDPSFDEIAQLPGGDVPALRAEEMDGNGHLTVHDHVRVAAHGAHRLLVATVLTEDRRARTGSTVFTAEHHVRYLRELRPDAHARVHARMVDVSDRAVHLVSYLVDAGARRTATVLEALVLSVDLDRRRVAPFPADVRRLLTHTHAEHAALGWTPRLSGAIQIRH